MPMNVPMLLAVGADGDPGPATAAAPVATAPAGAAPVATAPAGSRPAGPIVVGGGGGGAVVAGGGAVTTQTQPGTQPARPIGFLEGLWQSGIPMILLLVVVFYFFMWRGPRREEKARKAQLSAMKKGDEVLLISGKFGTVVDVKEDRVVVKVDETNNVKETYLKSAIQRVIKDEEPKK